MNSLKNRLRPEEVEPSTFNIEWSPGELDVWRRREPLSVSQFAQRHIRVTLGAHIGAWDNSITPYLVTPMDTSDLPWVKEIVVCGPEQSGKTMICINIHAKNIVYRPGNIKYIMLPKETLAKKIARDRLITMYRLCAPIAEKLSLQPDDTASGRIAFRDGTVVYPIWGSSPSEMSSFPADFTFADEIDKNADLTGDESDALRLLEKRTRQFRRSLNLKCSTPTLETGHIWKALTACAEINDYYVVCPICGELQLMKEEGLTWPGQGKLFAAAAKSGQPEADPNTVKMAKSARYRCENKDCNALWSDLDRDRAVRAGAWVARDVVNRPHSVGFHITGFICPDISLSELAAAILSARGGDPAAEKERDNSYFGIPHCPQKVERKEDQILRLVDQHLPRGVVPPDTSTIVVKADTQQAGFMYQVVAFSYPAPEVTATLIDHGFVESFEALAEIGGKVLHDAEGKEYHAHAGFIDSGGGTNPYKPKHSRTVEVYEFCRLNKFWRPLKGRRDQATPWAVTRLDYYPSRDGKKRPIPGGLQLYTLNVTHFKNQLASRLAINPGDPGCIRLHAGVAEDGPYGGIKYAAQLCAEYRDERGYWECPKNKPNHFWDCWTYGFAAADILGVRRKQKPATDQTPARQRRIYSEGVQQ